MTRRCLNVHPVRCESKHWTTRYLSIHVCPDPSRCATEVEVAAAQSCVGGLRQALLRMTSVVGAATSGEGARFPLAVLKGLAA